MEFLLLALPVLAIAGAMMWWGRPRVPQAPPPELEPSPQPRELPRDGALPAVTMPPIQFYGLDVRLADQAPPSSPTPSPTRQVRMPPYAVKPRRATLGVAVRSNWRVEIVYCDLNGEWTARKVTPYWVGGTQGAWDHGFGHAKHLWGGYCHLRNEERKFHFDRTLAIEVEHEKQEMRDKYRVTEEM